MLFDSTLELGIKLPSPEGVKRVSVSFPSDADFSEWRRKKKIVQKDLGRRSFQIEASQPEQCDLDLLKKILVTEEGQPTPEIDEAEASYIVSKLAESEVPTKPEREGSTFRIPLRVMGKIDTVHVLRVPSMREMMKYDRERSAVKFGQYGQQEIRINFDAASKLYDELVKDKQGYAPASRVPVPHKAEAINVLLQEIRAEQEEDSSDDELG
jgi:hypothetical protein